MKQYIIIAGAGVSIAPPSNLPSWWEYNKKLIIQIKAEALKLCPEAADILKCIDVKNKLPVQCISQLIVSQGAGESYFPLLELLNGTVPNANHFALAEMARHGLLKAIVTTNFDTLIETAFRKEAVSLYTVVNRQEYYEATYISACKLFKIHGSVNDDASLIDTVSQKAIGLSYEKRLILENVFADNDIFVIGFSGADLDFDLDYIPLKQALENGRKLTWVIQPNSVPNPNVVELQKRYPENICVCKMELAEWFKSLGIDYANSQRNLPDTTMEENEIRLEQRIKELFSSVYIGPHGCVGYCLSLLDMLGAHEAAEKLAGIYEEKLDWSALDTLSILGINALARQKMTKRDWQGSIRCYNAVIQCIQQLIIQNRELKEKNDKLIYTEQSRRQEREYVQNLVVGYLNLGNVYYYMDVIEQADTLDKAKQFWEMAQSLQQQEPDIPYYSLILFEQARIQYRFDQNYDCYLDALHMSQEYAKKEGRLDTLVEILYEECKVRMLIGEYHLAQNALELSRNMLKNVGRAALTQAWENLNKQYRLRTGEQAELPSKELIQAFINGVNDPLRKRIILFEAQRQREHLAPLFSQLCQNYLDKRVWQRLRELAQCYYAVADTDLQKSDALYMLGCAAQEQASYLEAEMYFMQIVDMGNSENNIKMGWAHCELVRLFVQKADSSQAMYHFDECIHVLRKFGDMEQLTQAGANCVAAFLHGGYLEKAETIAAQLLDVIDASNAIKLQEYLECLYDKHNIGIDEDLRNQSPQTIATEALRLYDAGNTEQAWKWMRFAKKKYKETGNVDGIGRCENNMGGWCQTEGNYEKAAEHYKAAMDIKFSLGDVDGGISQLSTLLQIYVKTEDLKKAKALACYAEQNMPLYSDKMQRYVLYYGLFLYKLEINDYAAAYVYAQKAEEGMQYLSRVYPGCRERLYEFIDLLKNMFTCRTEFSELSDFEVQALEAERLGKSGKLNDSLALIEQLKKACGKDSMRNGILNGIRANAYLCNKKYDEAIGGYSMAMKAFEAVIGDEKETAMEHRVTAVNGMAVALGHLGKDEEAIALFCQELKRAGLSQKSRCFLTVNLCNRLIIFNQNTLRKDDDVFTVILKSLNVLCGLSHEEWGSVYCTYGMLYMAVGDDESAKHYYQQAKKEFLIVNSQHLTEVEQALAILEN